MANVTLSVSYTHLDVYKRQVQATTHYNEPDVLAEVSRGLGEAMVGIEIDKIPQEQLMARRGW